LTLKVHLNTRILTMSEAPLPPGVGVVFPFNNEDNWRLVTRIIEATTGIRPMGRRDSEGVKRALYAEATTRTILNVSAPEILKRLGWPTAVMTLQVEDTKSGAKIAMDMYRAHGHAATMIDATDAEVGGVPRGFMYFVLVPTLVPLLFWPLNPDPDMMARMPRPEPWAD
jgi:hypothetical protein